MCIEFGRKAKASLFALGKQNDSDERNPLCDRIQCTCLSIHLHSNDKNHHNTINRWRLDFYQSRCIWRSFNIATRWIKFMAKKMRDPAPPFFRSSSSSYGRTHNQGDSWILELSPRGIGSSTECYIRYILSQIQLAILVCLCICITLYVYDSICYRVQPFISSIFLWYLYSQHIITYH